LDIFLTIEEIDARRIKLHRKASWRGAWYKVGATEVDIETEEYEERGLAAWWSRERAMKGK
jgi:hypothetical protein